MAKKQKDKTQAEIFALWRERGFIPTAERLQIAKIRTKHPYGLTLSGTPYLTPYVGMKVVAENQHGRVIGIGEQEGDPEAKIRLESGRVVYLFQTAIHGYIAVSRKTKQTN